MPVQHRSQQEGRDFFFSVLALLCLVRFAFLAAHLVYPDLNLDYPFLDGDSHDWIANGLAFAGHDVRFPGRPPLFPLTLALLDRLGALSWLPVLLQALFHATVLAFYGLAARLAPRPAAFAAALALLLNHSLGSLSLQVMADVPASCLLFLAARAFVIAGSGGRGYLTSGVLAGLSGLTQQAALLWPIPVAATMLTLRRRDLRSHWFVAGVLAFVGMRVAWMAVKSLGLGGEGLTDNWQNLRPHDGSGFYLYNLAALLGWPGLLLLVAGAGLAAWKASREPRSAPHLFILTLTVTLLVFFTFFYAFNARRFLAYAAWPAGLLIAEALGRLRGRAVFGAAAALLCAGSALPLPGPGNDSAWLGVWPLPPVHAFAEVVAAPNGSPELRLDPIVPIALFPDSPRIWIEWSNEYRVWKANAKRQERRRTERRLDPALFAGDRSALFLYGDLGDGGGRYRAITRVGNALRKRVKFVPASHFEPYWPWIEVAPVGRAASDIAVYRARLPGLADSWLLVTSGASLTPMHGPPAGTPADTPGLARGREKAAAILRFIGASDGYVALIPDRRGAEPAHLYLPFLVDTTELYVAEPGREREVWDAVAAAPVLGQKRFGRTEVWKVEILGRKASVVSSLRGTGAPPRRPPPPPRRSPPPRPARGAAGRPGG
jgi:hypothetical protein